MPVNNSRLQGFYQLSVKERRSKIADIANLSEKQVAAWSSDNGLSEETADGMIENVVGTYSLPIGVATNFIIDNEHYLIPFVVEEASIVAAASNMAKRCQTMGGFKSDNDKPVMIGQIQIVDCKNSEEVRKAILDAKSELILKCNEVDPILVKLGGGCQDIEVHTIETQSGTMLIVHLLVDCRDAMGANAVNSMAETIAPYLETLSKATVVLRIISNLAVHRLARVCAVFTAEEMSDDGENKESGKEIITGVVRAYHFAVADQFRATTHNKGIMNGISAVAVACGQDWRAIEAGAHSYCAYKRNYGSLTHWEIDAQGNLHGSIACPMAVGLVGGTVGIHPTAQTNIALLGIKSANDLAKCIAAAGLAQNLGALRALATTGIQTGHMKLHLRNMLVAADADGEEIEYVTNKIRLSNSKITMTIVENTLAEFRQKS
ncbi:MAG: hydroxymethylglutaryl-CoA reductase, degradative [SAR324 cluster bacterium]|nr:hydroxymethylglutaryl-CoA reductase, degradative [SAR324 cluster bacterium]MBL7035257.1 hydroxymethylglutaryl-CoA reductase, degradative [SAR324 cluster bacterium]